jgi:preprotein translocase subunit SecA
VSLDDEIFSVFAPRATRLMRRLGMVRSMFPVDMSQWLRLLAQHFAERRSAELRMQNFKLDQRLDDMLAFSGRGE